MVKSIKGFPSLENTRETEKQIFFPFRCLHDINDDISAAKVNEAFDLFKKKFFFFLVSVLLHLKMENLNIRRAK